MVGLFLCLWQGMKKAARASCFSKSMLARIGDLIPGRDDFTIAGGVNRDGRVDIA